MGKPVLEEGIRNPTAVTDGNVTGYDASKGFASFRWPGELTVDLERVYRLHAIRLLLWDGRGSGSERDSRRYQYAILTSHDQQSWTQQYETDKNGSNGWQVFEAAEPVGARFIRVQGRHNTANNSFHIVQLEAHDAEPPPLEQVELSKLIPPGAARKPARIDQMMRPRFGSSLHAGILLDQYHLKRFINQGQSAQVWEAEVMRVPAGVEGLVVGDTVAVKVYDLPERSGIQTIRTQREFKVASELKHPNLVKVFDAVISPSRPWHHFLVMEYVEGVTLKDFVVDHSLSGRETLTIAQQLFGALDGLHRRGVYHRDVKAANTMLVDAEEMQIKLMDLGIAASETDASLTSQSTFVGSKHSASFEQLTGGVFDQRSDIYSAGTVLYHCYAGAPPYDGVGPAPAIAVKMEKQPEVLVAKTDDDGEVVDFINTCMAKEKGSRPQNAEAALSQIERLLKV